MSRKSVLTVARIRYACEICGEEITHDVARVDAGRIFHMRCFAEHLQGGTKQKAGLRECPACLTLGALWNWGHSEWNECEVCSGTGYLKGVSDTDSQAAS